MTATPEDHQPLAGPPAPPAPLTVAASLVVVEAILFVILAGAELADFESSKAVMGTTTALFFLAYGAGLALCGWAIWRLRSWGRAPIVVAQLIQLLVAWSFWGGETTWIAIGAGLVALVVLAGIFHPQSLEALAERS